MDYTYKLEGLEYVVRGEGDQRYGSYDQRHKAVRRIRDLKAKELKAGVHSNLKVPDDIDAIIDAIECEREANTDGIDVRQVGCYPAVSKHSYRR